MSKDNYRKSAGKPLNEGSAEESGYTPTPSSESDGATSGRNAKPLTKSSARSAKATHGAAHSRSRKQDAGLESTPAGQKDDKPAIRVGRIRAARDEARMERAVKSGERYLSRKHRWNKLSGKSNLPQVGMPQGGLSETGSSVSQRAGGGGAKEQDMRDGNMAEEVVGVMDMPLFPLKNVVLFPGMVLPLQIFEHRYREMINRCIEEEAQFGVVLIEEGEEVGEGAIPYRVGTAAKITKVTRLEDGRLNIVAVGTQRFEILSIDDSRSYLQAQVKPLPIVNGGTRLASDLVQQLLPRIFEYVEMLERATKQKLPISRLPEDPTTLAILVGIGMQAPPKDKQRLLEKSGVPEMLAFEGHLLSREAMFLRHMVETQHDVQQLNTGPTGYIFPN